MEGTSLCEVIYSLTAPHQLFEEDEYHLQDFLKKHYGLDRSQVDLKLFGSLGCAVFKVIPKDGQKPFVARFYRNLSEEQEIDEKVFACMVEAGHMKIQILEQNAFCRFESYLESERMRYEDCFNLELQKDFVKQIAFLNYNEELVKFCHKKHLVYNLEKRMFDAEEGYYYRFRKIKDELFKILPDEPEYQSVVSYYEEMTKDLDQFKQMYSEVIDPDVRKEIDIVFCHNDIWSDNVLILNEEPKTKLQVIDFEECVLGQRGLDLAALIVESDMYTVDAHFEKKGTLEDLNLESRFVEDLQAEGEISNFLLVEFLKCSFQYLKSKFKDDVQESEFIKEELPVLREQVKRLLIENCLHWGFQGLVQSHYQYPEMKLVDIQMDMSRVHLGVLMNYRKVLKVKEVQKKHWEIK